MSNLRLIVCFLSMGFFFISNVASAQDETVTNLRKKTESIKDIPANDSGKIWTTGGNYTMTIGQGSQKNWAAGGDDFSFSLNGYLNLWALYKKDKISWDNIARLNYGFLNTTSQGTRKNDDRIDLTSKVGYALAEKINLAFLANFQSQFTKGYQYHSDGTKELTSNFMAPGYLILSLGVDFKPAKGLSIFVSPVTSRWTFVHNQELSDLGAYGVIPGEKSKNEIGAFASINYNKKLSENIIYSGKLDLFSNYKKKPQNVDLMMSNMLTFKISKALSANVGLDMIYDDDIRLFGPKMMLRHYS